MSINAANNAKAGSVPKLSMLILAVGVLVLAGCGSSSSSSTSSTSPPSVAASTPTTSSSPASATSGAQGLSLQANTEGQLKYSKTSLTAKAGNVSIGFTNMASLEHNVTIASASGTVLGATPTFQGATKTLSLNLKPGTYKFYCSVPGHRAAGMEGTLTVR